MYKLQNPAYRFALFLFGSIILKNIFWTVPFLFFVGGYFIVKSIFHIPSLPAPSVIGKPLTEALVILSDHNLTAQLLNQKEDSGLAEGTIIDQTPPSGQAVRTRQTIFLSVSKKPSLSITPSIIGTYHQEIKEKLSKSGIKLRAYFLTSTYPTNSCIAQIPSAGSPLFDCTITAYFSKETSKPVVWPYFIGKPLTQVREFLDQYHITPDIQNQVPGKPDQTCIVTNQHPPAGSCITLNPQKPPLVQLCVE